MRRPRPRSLLAALAAVACTQTVVAPAERPVQLPPVAAWPLFRGDLARDGHPGSALLTADEATRLRPAWSVRVGDSIVGSPVVAGGMVVAGTLDGTLAAYSTEQGTEVWRLTGLGSLVGEPTVYQGKVFVGSGEGRLLAFALENGERIWDWRAPGVRPLVGGSPSLYGGLLVAGVGSSEGAGAPEAGRLVALDPASGDSVWSTCLVAGCGPGDGVRSSPAIDPRGIGFVGVGPPGSAVVAFDVGIGRVLWKTRLDPVGGGAFGVGTPLLFLSATRELVAARSDSGVFAVLDARTGTVVWKVALARAAAGAGSAGSAGFDGHAFYLPSAAEPGALYALSPQEGRILWQHAAALPLLTSPAVGVGVLVYGAGSGAEGGVTALATADGRQLWSVEGGSAVVASPVIAGHSVYAADIGGRLMAFRN